MKVRTIFLVFLAVSFFSFPSYSGTVVYEADVKPWSGYWWPSTLGGMLTGVGYRGHPTVLEKLEGISPAESGRVKEWYQQNFFKPEGEAWFGLCHAWALAAAYEPEPTRGGVFHGVPLSIGEKKALLTLAHAEDVSYKANGYDPLVFHQWILRFLKENRKPFVINLGLDGEVWFYPAYRAQVDGRDFPDRTEFDTLLWFASSSVPPEFKGTLNGMNRQTYILYKDRAGHYTHGEWTGESTQNYPIALWSTLERQGAPGLDLAIVDAAVNSTTDDLSTTLLRPGSFSAFFAGTWRGQLEARAGEWLELEFSLEDRLVTLPVTLSDGVASLSETVTQANPRVRYLTRRDNPTLTITPEARLTNSPFSLRFDLARTPLIAMTRRDADLLWAGLAGISNLPVGKADALLLTARAKGGHPLHSISLPVQGGAKFSQVVNLPEFDKWAFGRAEHFEVSATSASSLVGLAANMKGMSAFSTPPSSGRQVAYGALPSTDVVTAFYVRNYEPRAVDGTIRAWEGAEGVEEGGREVLSAPITLGPHELRFFSWGADPLPFTHEPGLFGIDFGNARVGVDACFVDRDSTEMVPGVGAFSKEFLFSHYPNTGGWQTSVHILNPSTSMAEVGFETADGRKLHTVFVPAHRSVEINSDVLPQTGKTLRVRSNVGVAAHVQYRAVGGDWATLPLSRPDRTKTEILVPHVPDVPWWTGVILDYSGQKSCEVRLEYLGAKGEVLRTERRTLNAHESWVFAADRSPQTASLRIRSSSALGCGILYGSDDNAHVAGYTP